MCHLDLSDIYVRGPDVRVFPLRDRKQQREGSHGSHEMARPGIRGDQCLERASNVHVSASRGIANSESNSITEAKTPFRPPVFVLHSIRRGAHCDNQLRHVANPGNFDKYIFASTPGLRLQVR